MSKLIIPVFMQHTYQRIQIPDVYGYIHRVICHLLISVMYF